MARGGSKPGERRGGRAPGTPNKITFDLMNTLKEQGFDPAAELVKIHIEAMAQYQKRLEASPTGFGSVGLLQIAKDSAADLMEYVYPKRKAVELTGKDGADLFQSFNDMVRAVAAANQKPPSNEQ